MQNISLTPGQEKTFLGGEASSLVKMTLRLRAGILLQLDSNNQRIKLMRLHLPRRREKLGLAFSHWSYKKVIISDHTWGLVSWPQFNSKTITK